MKQPFHILFTILLSIWGMPSVAQVTQTAEESVYNTLVDSTMLAFIKEQGISQLPQLSLLTELSDFITLPAEITALDSNQFQLPQFNAALNIDNFYRSGDTSLLIGEAGLFTNLNLEAGVAVMGIPLQSSFNTVLKNGQLQRDFSTVSLRFDASAYREQLIAKYESVKEWGSILDESENMLSFSPAELEGLKNELRYEFYRQLRNHPKIQELKQTVSATIDSLQQSVDSTLVGMQDSVQAKYGIAAEQLEKIEEQYNQYWEWKKSAENYTELKAIKQKIKAAKEKWQAALDPTHQLQALLKNKALSKKEKWLAMTAGLEIGQFVLDQHDFTVNQMSVAGVRYQYQKDKYFGQVAYGKQYQKALYHPLFNAPVANALTGRHFWLASGGMQTAQQGISLTTLYATDRDEPDSVFTFPQHNLVVATQAHQQIGRNFRVEGSAALSRNMIGQGNVPIETTTDQQAERLATELLLVKEGERMTIGAGYFYTGRQFVSLGNPFLLLGRQGLSTKLSTNWWKGKVALNVEGKYGWSLDATTDPSSFTEWQIKGELSVQAGKNGTITGQFIPNTLQQQQSETTLTSNSNIFALQGFFQHKIGKQRLLSALSFTNLKTDYTIGDTLQNDQRLYLYGRESLNLLGGRLVNLTYRIGGKTLPSADDYLLQLDYDFPIKMIRIKLGAQLLHTPFSEYWQGGIVNRVSFALGNYGNLEWRTIYQRTFKGNSYQFTGNLSLRIYLFTGTKNI